jgi:hypothetical protein
MKDNEDKLKNSKSVASSAANSRYEIVKLLIACLLGVLISLASTVLLFRSKFGKSVFFNRQDEIFERISVLDTNLGDINRKVSSIETSVSGTEKEISEKLSRIGELREELSLVSERLDDLERNFKSVELDISEKPKTQPPEYEIFLSTLGVLIKNGTPFEEFLDANSSKIDIKKYSSATHLLFFKNKKVMSIEDLKEKFHLIARNWFGLNVEEPSVQKKFGSIKEKFLSFFGFLNAGTKQLDSNNIRQIMQSAHEKVDSGELLEAIEVLAPISESNSAIRGFIQDSWYRIKLDDAFNNLVHSFNTENRL